MHHTLPLPRFPQTKLTDARHKVRRLRELLDKGVDPRISRPKRRLSQAELPRPIAKRLIYRTSSRSTGSRRRATTPLQIQPFARIDTNMGGRPSSAAPIEASRSHTKRSAGESETHLVRLSP